MEAKIFGLTAKYQDFTLKPLKKMDYKAFCNFSLEYDKTQVTLDEFLEIYAGKEFAYLQSGKVFLYLFKKSQEENDQCKIVGYSEITPTEEEGECEVGYYILERERNNGYATKMLQSILLLCEKMDYSNIFAKVKKDNEPSKRVLEKCGFLLESQQGEQEIYREEKK